MDCTLYSQIYDTVFFPWLLLFVLFILFIWKSNIWIHAKTTLTLSDKTNHNNKINNGAHFFWISAGSNVIGSALLWMHAAHSCVLDKLLTPQVTYVLVDGARSSSPDKARGHRLESWRQQRASTWSSTDGLATPTPIPTTAGEAYNAMPGRPPPPPPS